MSGFYFYLLSWILFAQTGIRASQLLDEMNAQYARDYGITIVADGEVYPLAAGPSIDAQNTGKNNGDMVLYFLRKEFAKYPAALIRQSGIKRIVLCKELKDGGRRIAGVAVERNASIYVDSTTKVGDEAHRRRTLHHELFHFLDYAQHADVRNNPAWQKANAPGFNYGSTPPASKPGQYNWASHPVAGILSDYAMKALPEDRAELFAALMTNNLTLRLVVQRDAYLAGTVKMLKEELLHFCPAVDDAFWSRTAAF